MTLRLTLGLFLYMLVIVTGSALADNCAGLSFSSPSTYIMANGNNVAKCLRSVPLRTSQIRTDLFDSIKSYWEMYSFRDMVLNATKNVPNSFDIAVDVPAALDAVAGQSFSNDADFQSSLHGVFHAVKDGHTFYSKPGCYAKFVFGIPLSLVTSSGRLYASTSLLFSSSILSNYASITGVNLNSLGSYFQILEINGQDALQKINDWANSEIYVTKDDAVAMNVAIQGDASQYHGFGGGYLYRLISHHSVPTADEMLLNITYVPYGSSVNQNVTVSLPMVAFVFRSISSEADLESFCYPSSNQEVNPSLSAMSPEADVSNVDTHTDVEDSVKLSATSDVAVLPNVIFTGNSGVIYLSKMTDASANVYGFLRIVGFSAPGKAPYGKYPVSTTFLNDLKGAISAAVDNGVTHLVVDTIANGGGWVCLSAHVIHFLSNDSSPEGIYDQIHSPQWRDAYSWVHQNMSARSDELYIVPKMDLNAMWNGPMKTRGGKTSQYTNTFSFDLCDEPWVSNENGILTWPKERLLVLSDGLCGSACAYFAKQLKLKHGVETVSLTAKPSPGASVQYTSFTGGIARSASQERTHFTNMNAKGCNVTVPKSMTPSQFNFNWMELYLDGSSVPSEFVRANADHVIEDSLYFRHKTYRENVWKKVMNLTPFKNTTCTAGTHIPCGSSQAGFGFGVRMCKADGSDFSDFCSAPTPTPTATATPTGTPTPVPSSASASGFLHGLTVAVVTAALLAVIGFM